MSFFTTGSSICLRIKKNVTHKHDHNVQLMVAFVVGSNTHLKFADISYNTLLIILQWFSSFSKYASYLSCYCCFGRNLQFCATENDFRYNNYYIYVRLRHILWHLACKNNLMLPTFRRHNNSGRKSAYVCIKNINNSYYDGN